MNDDVVISMNHGPVHAVYKIRHNFSVYSIINIFIMIGLFKVIVV